MKSVLSRVFLYFSLMLFANQAFAQEIPPSAFAPHVQYMQAKISPDGKYLAVRMMSKGKSALVVLSTANFKPVGGLNLPLKQEVGDFFWANNERIVSQIYEKRAWSELPANYGELFAVNYDGSDGELIYSFRNENSNSRTNTSSKVKQKESVKGWARVIDRLEDDEDNILISSEPWSQNGDIPAYVHKLNIYSGKLGRPQTRSPIPDSYFVYDRDGSVKYSAGRDKQNINVMYEYLKDKDEWKQFEGFAIGSSFSALGLDEEGENLYVFNNADNDKTQLFRYSIESGKLAKLYGDENVDLDDIVETERGKIPYALRVESGFPEYLIINKKVPEATVFRNVLATFPGLRVHLTSSNLEGNKWVILTESDTSPGSFYFYDQTSGKMTFLFKAFNSVPEKQLARMDPVSFTTSDGAEVSGFLTKPNTKGKAPLVTLVHGGPLARDYWGFSRVVQMLAGQGYAVLQVNFRGSTGYGEKHMVAGYKSWGSTIQKDIIEGTKWAMNQEGIDSEKACIMGGSFGAYSALQSSVLEPDLFKCAVANVGVYDLEELFEDGDVPDRWAGEAFLEMQLGTDKEQLRDFSPVNHVSKLKAPVFIAHGENDERAPIEQAEALKKQLDKHDKEYVWFIKDYEGHGFYSPENRAEYYEAVAEFMAKYLK